MRLVLRQIAKYPSSNRKQNFFELNPIYPDYGEKDFDIYNVEHHRVPVFDKYIPIRQRENKLKLLIREQFLMRKYRLKQVQKQTSDADIDEDSGLPIGVNTTYDSFIAEYKKNKNKNKKVQHEFKALLMRLIEKFKVKSEIELIKLFRISLAHSEKNDFKERIKGKLIEEAIARATASRNNYFSDFFTDQKVRNEEPTPGEMNEQELDQASFRQALKKIDQKITKIQSELQRRDPDWDPIYGRHINEPITNNYNYDMNLKRGSRGSKQSEQPVNMSSQDEHIRRRINKLFFLRKLEYLKKETLFDFNIDDIPPTIRDKERIINELAHKYKDDDFLIEPDLQDIYNEIDMTLSKVNVRLNSQINAKHNSGAKQDQIIDETVVTNDSMIWHRLDVEKVFASDYYSESNIKKQNISERELLHVSPTAGTQLSLNRVPFNLFRHSQCQIFNVFTKYKHMIIRDYQKDMTIDPKEEFNYFSLEEASDILKRIKKPAIDEGEKYYGTAKRKSAESQVFMKHGTGKVMVNGEPINEYFADVYHRVEALKPLIFSQTAGQYDLQFNVVGGGIHSQSECMAYALAKALMKINPEYRAIFASFALDKHDPRKKEPKRIGLYSARVRPPYVRR